MSERPIIMSAESVRAILAGRKTQTRRVVRHPDATAGYDVTPTTEGGWAWLLDGDMGYGETVRCPYGDPGQRLWVREQHRFWSQSDSPTDPRVLVQYRADMAEKWRNATPKPAHTADEGGAPLRWRSPIFMPRWACRLTLEVCSVRVERLQAITEEDAVAEGAPAEDEGPVGCCRCGFIKAWNRVNGKRPGCRWDDSPWVWVLSFRRLP